MNKMTNIFFVEPPGHVGDGSDQGLMSWGEGGHGWGEDGIAGGVDIDR